MNTNPFKSSCPVAGCRHARPCPDHTDLQARQVMGGDRGFKIFYDSARWRKLRHALLTETPFCRCEECQAQGIKRLATVIHHKDKHHGNEALFFNVMNLQPMAKACHDRVTGRGVGKMFPNAAASPTAPGVASETSSFRKGV